MVGVIVVSHGELARALVDSASLLVGEGERLACTGIFPGDDPGEFYERVRECALSVDGGCGVVALADLYGGTPNNVLYKLSREINLRIVTGANLPMVMHVIAERQPETTPQELIEGLLATAKQGIEEFAPRV